VAAFERQKPRLRRDEEEQQEQERRHPDLGRLPGIEKGRRPELCLEGQPRRHSGGAEQRVDQKDQPREPEQE
jgi:hypothetical protein